MSATRSATPLRCGARSLAALLACSALAMGQADPRRVAQPPETTTAPASLAPSDLAFVRSARQASEAQLTAAALALERSRDVRVRQFANRLVRDHTAVLARLERIEPAQAASPAGQGPQSIAFSLADLRGTAFDRRFVSSVGIEAHRDAIRLFGDAARTSRVPALARFASSTLPMLRKQLAGAEALQAQFELRRRNFSEPGGPVVR